MSAQSQAAAEKVREAIPNLLNFEYMRDNHFVSKQTWDSFKTSKQCRRMTTQINADIWQAYKAFGMYKDPVVEYIKMQQRNNERLKEYRKQRLALRRAAKERKRKALANRL